LKFFVANGFAIQLDAEFALILREHREAGDSGVLLLIGNASDSASENQERSKADR
jgi:hypothetical protein